MFFSTIAGTHPETGLILEGADDLLMETRELLTRDRHIDPMEWPIVAQTWGIYQGFQRGLAPFGGTLDNLVRTNTAFGHYYDFVGFERTRAGFLKTAPPASTVMETSWLNVDPRVRVIMHGWATLPGGEHNFVKSAVTSGSVSSAAAHFSLAIHSGPFVWPSGQVGRHPTTAAYVEHWSELPEEVPWLNSGNRHLDNREGAMSAQAWMTYENLRRIIAERSCSLNDVVHETIYIKNIDHLPALDRVRRQLWPEAADAPATTVVQVRDLGVVPRSLLEIDFVVLEPNNQQGWRREATLEVGGVRSAVHGPVATAAGPFRFVAGQHGLLDDDRPAENLSGLTGGIRALHAGHIYAERPAEAQSWLAYGRIRRVLDRLGASPGHLAKIDAYIQDAADAVVLQRVGEVALEGATPAMATVPVMRAGRTPSHVLVMDAIAYVG